MESEPQVDTASPPAVQPSGNRALPSPDDGINGSDSDPLLNNNNSPQKTVERVGKTENSTNNSSNSSGDGTFTSGSNGSFVSGEEKLAGIDEETSGEPVEVGQNGAPAVGSSLGPPGLPAQKASAPIEKVSGDEDDDKDKRVGEKEHVIDGGNEVGAAPGVRVLGEVDVEGENGDVGVREELKADSLEEKRDGVDGGGVASGVEDNASLDSEVVDGVGVKFTDEGDAVVDSRHVNGSEVMRLGAADVGVEDSGESVDVVSKTDESDVVMTTKGELSVEQFTNVDDVELGAALVAKEVEERKDLNGEPGNMENAVVEEVASADSAAVEGDGVKLTEEGDSVVDSIHVDAGEAARSGAAIVGEVEGGKGLEKIGAEMENSVVEESAPVIEDSVVEESAPVIEDSVVDRSLLADSKATESTGEDSVVDVIHVDAGETVRSGIVVIGDSNGEGKGADIEANLTSGNEFEQLISANPKSVGNNDIEAADQQEHKDGQVNEVEMAQSGQTAEPSNKEDIKPETDVESKEHEPSGGVQVVPGGVEEKVLLDDVNDEPHAGSSAVGGEAKNVRSYASVLLDEPDAASSGETHLHEKVEQTKPQSPETGEKVEDRNHVSREEVDVANSGTEGESKYVMSGSAANTSQLVEELERAFDAPPGSQIVTDSEEEAQSDDEGEEKEMFDSAALAALLKAATNAGSDPGAISITSQDGSRLFSVERPFGLGPSLRSVRPASRPTSSSLFTPPSSAAPSEENLTEDDKKKLQLMHQLRVKFLRLVHRLGHAAEDSIAAQVLYRLALLAGRTSPAFSLENAKQTAMQLEVEGKDDLDLSLNILVLGKTGVGKSATINSIFGEEVVKINAFEPETTSVREINGILEGVKITVIEAPGLRSSGMEQGFNRKVLASVKKFTKRYPPDVMLYVDRLDSQNRDLNDLPMLRTITSSLGSSIWRSAIVTLTHASCAPPDGPTGSPLSYEVFVAQRSHFVQQLIGQAVGDLRLMNPSLMNPVSLVENHLACRKNREGQRVLPNGQAWRPQLLLLCYSLKILSEANSASKPQDTFDHRKFFGFRTRSVPLPYLLSTMLQPRAHPKLSTDQGGDNGDSDIDLEDLSDSDQEVEEDEYDQLPPFKPLRKVQIAKLSRDQRKAYFEEYDYRVKLFQRKQWREELKRIREMKKGKSGVDDYGEMPEDLDGANEAPAAVPVPLPDMVLPPSFDSDNPAYRYRFLEPTSQFLARPVLDTHGWDHDCGYDGVNVEQSLGIAGRFPAAVAVQVTKDKKEFNIHLDSAVSAKHGDNGSSLVGFDIQTLGKQPAYIVRGESKFRTLKKNKTGAGVSVTFLGENVATGVKVEDQITLGKRLVLLGSTGTVRSQKDAAYGANLEVRLREADYPIGQDQSSLHLSLMKWRGDLAIGGNLQSQLSLGRSSKMAVRVSLNNKLSGQISVKTSSSDHLQLALAGLIPIALSIYRNLRPSASENYSLY